MMSTRFKADFYMNTDFLFFFALPLLVEDCDKSLMTGSDRNRRSLCYNMGRSDGGQYYGLPRLSREFILNRASLSDEEVTSAGS